MHCPRTVPELLSLTGLELSLEQKQIPQVVENSENECSGCNGWKERLFAPRQVRYQAALRPDITTIAGIRIQEAQPPRNHARSLRATLIIPQPATADRLAV